MQKPTVLLTLLAVLASGCSAPSPAPHPPGTATSFFGNAEITASAPTQPVIVQAPSTDECKNPFYPVHNGAWWMYSLSNGSRPSHTMSVGRDNTFTVTVQSEDGTFVIEGQCTEAGILLLNLPGAAVSYSGEQGNSTIIAQNVEGVTLPNDVQPGDNWSQTLNVISGNVDAIIETSYNAIGYETVNIPVGSFNALKVEQNGTVNMGGQTFNSHAFFWYAQDIGVVKSVIDGVSSSELFAYNFP
jgi:hypothetical protein